MDELRALDPDPVFITLPVVPKVGAVSKNGLLYDEALVKSIEMQINAKRPGGRFGHLREEERDTAFPIPEGMWLGAKREGDTLWAKAYVHGAAREHVRRLKAVGGSIATSIYGKGQYEPTEQKGVRRLTNFDLESLDFAPPERAALGYAAAPIVTSEMETPMDRNQIISELTVDEIPARLRDALVAEYRTQVADRDTLITSLQTTVAEFRRQQFEGAVDARVAELTAWQTTGDEAKKKLDAFRRTLRSRIVSELAGDASKLEAVIETIWTDLQPLAETVRDALAGPPAIVAGKVQTGQRPVLEDTPANRAKARAEFQF
ncbi:MAG: hypothetical protein E6Q97_14340 [Desulfurellales bacterium]|nr:MAG: hypothetical protein E6Q97_14340 [Desulfurellales bacterium]